jgi:DNA polymerase V
MPGRPLLSSAVPAGLPAQADGSFRRFLSLDEHLIEQPDATYFAHVAGDSMTGFGIHDGDLLIVDRALDPADRSIVIAVVDGEFTVKQYRRLPVGILLRAGGEGHGDILVTEDQRFDIWGVVRWSVHKI